MRGSPYFPVGEIRMSPVSREGRDGKGRNGLFQSAEYIRRHLWICSWVCLPDFSLPDIGCATMQHNIKIQGMWLCEMGGTGMLEISEHHLLRSKTILSFNPRPRCFATFAGVGGGGCNPPWRFQTKRRRASRKRPADYSRRVGTREWWYYFWS